MEDFQFWLYVIIAVIYVLSRALKKKPGAEPGENTPRKASGRTASQPGRPKQITFEELLKEITEGKTASQQPGQQPAPSSYKPPVTRTPPPQPAYVDYDDDLQDEEQDLEDINYDYRQKDKVYDVYEEAKKQAFSRPSYEDTTKTQESELGFGKFKEFGIKKRKTILTEYVAELKKPGGFKKAVVLSEILNRKY